MRRNLLGLILTLVVICFCALAYTEDKTPAQSVRAAIREWIDAETEEVIRLNSLPPLSLFQNEDLAQLHRAIQAVRMSEKLITGTEPQDEELFIDLRRVEIGLEALISNQDRIKFLANAQLLKTRLPSRFSCETKENSQFCEGDAFASGSIAVLDTGAFGDTDSDLTPLYRPFSPDWNLDTVDGDSYPDDSNTPTRASHGYHGTRIIEKISKAGNRYDGGVLTRLGLQKLLLKNIYPVKIFGVLDEVPFAPYGDKAVEALARLISHGLRVVNFSGSFRTELSNGYYLPIINENFSKLILSSKDTIFVLAAGNEGRTLKKGFERPSFELGKFLAHDRTRQVEFQPISLFPQSLVSDTGERPQNVLTVGTFSIDVSDAVVNDPGTNHGPGMIDVLVQSNYGWKQDNEDAGIYMAGTSPAAAVVSKAIWSIIEAERNFRNHDPSVHEVREIFSELCRKDSIDHKVLDRDFGPEILLFRTTFWLNFASRYAPLTTVPASQ